MNRMDYIVNLHELKQPNKDTAVYPAGSYETCPGNAEFKNITISVINHDSK
jgi:hypothetical protein